MLQEQLEQLIQSAERGDVASREELFTRSLPRVASSRAARAATQCVPDHQPDDAAARDLPQSLGPHGECVPGPRTLPGVCRTRDAWATHRLHSQPPRAEARGWLRDHLASHRGSRRCGNRGRARGHRLRHSMRLGPSSRAWRSLSISSSSAASPSRRSPSCRAFPSAPRNATGTRPASCCSGTSAVTRPRHRRTSGRES